MTQAAAAVVRRQIVVEAPIERAFTVFTERFGDFKPPEHNLLGAPISETVFEPRVGNWVFRGYSPGGHINASSLRYRLRTVFSTRAARLGTLHELTKLAPTTVIAEALGYSPGTTERHAVSSASTYARYIGTRADSKT